MIIDLHRARRQIGLLRRVSWVVFGGKLLVIIGCCRLLIHNPGELWPLLKVFWPVLIFWELLPLAASRWAFGKKQHVGVEGNHWQIGRYSEQQVRSHSD